MERETGSILSTPDLNATMVPNSNDDTLTPGYRTPLPPPPQFGNDSQPPPYQEAIHRSSLMFNMNSNNSNNNTLPGNNPGNRLSFAHHQPIMLDDDVASERSTPSPTTHHLVLSPEDAAPEESYNFYETHYKQLSLSRQPNDSVKVTFVWVQSRFILLFEEIYIYIYFYTCK